MKFENSKARNGKPRFYCEGCKRNVLTDDILSDHILISDQEYRSLTKNLKMKKVSFHENYENKDKRIRHLESTDVDTEESDGETKVLLKGRQTEIDIKTSEHTDDKDFEIEVLKYENIRLKKIIDLTKRATTSMNDFYSESAFTLAMRRLPALYLTLMIELVGGMIISYFEDVIKKYTLLVSFMPALSALSGIRVNLLKYSKNMFIMKYMLTSSTFLL